MESLCTWSSLFFLTNAFHALMIGEYLYGILFILLTMSSFVYHLKPTQDKQIIDKIFVYMVVAYGGYKLYKNFIYQNTFLIIALFLSTVVLYHIGKETNTMCFHPDETIQQYYHVFMHFLASLGHHLIINGVSL